jgi:hypothetical protein
MQREYALPTAPVKKSNGLSVVSSFRTVKVSQTRSQCDAKKGNAVIVSFPRQTQLGRCVVARRTICNVQPVGNLTDLNWPMFPLTPASPSKPQHASTGFPASRSTLAPSFPASRSALAPVFPAERLLTIFVQFGYGYGK